MTPLWIYASAFGAACVWFRHSSELENNLTLRVFFPTSGWLLAKTLVVDTRVVRPLEAAGTRTDRSSVLDRAAKREERAIVTTQGHLQKLSGSPNNARGHAQLLVEVVSLF